MASKIIAIAGGTGSGKSTLADALALQLGAVVIRIDDYYRPLNHLTFEEREQVNFDAPESIDHVLLMEHLSDLQRGRPVEKPIYDFSRHTRAVFGEIIEPHAIVIIEGLFSLYWKDLNELYQARIFVETPRDLRFERRLRRDIEERGRDTEEVTFRFNSHVNPMHEVYVQPTSLKADLVVYGDDLFENEFARVMDHLVAAGPVLL
jgi:uridine kinase